MNLIAIETATDVCGVVLMQEGRGVVELTLKRPRAHAEHLVPLVEDALSYGNISPRDLGAVAVSMGPGSYTGLRIGVSTAKGLAVALDARLIGVPTLEALAASVASMARPGDSVLTLLPSRRDEVYAATYLVAVDGSLQALEEAAALHIDALVEWVGTPSATLWTVGEGMRKAGDRLQEAFGNQVRLLDPTLHGPSAAWVARLALPRLKRGDAADVASFEPFYLKDFVAKKRKRTIFERLPF